METSPKPTTEFFLDDLVEDLEYLRKKLEINKAYFIGHSLGGMIAPAYSLKYSKHVLALRFNCQLQLEELKKIRKKF